MILGARSRMLPAKPIFEWDLTPIPRSSFVRMRIKSDPNPFPKFLLWWWWP